MDEDNETHTEEITNLNAIGLSPATYNSTTKRITWAMGEHFSPDDGVTYTATCIVWPDQAAYDAVAAYENDPTNNPLPEGILADYTVPTNGDDVNVAYTRSTVRGSVPTPTKVFRPDDGELSNYLPDGLTLNEQGQYINTNGDVVEISDSVDVDRNEEPVPVVPMDMVVQKTWENALDTRVDTFTIRIYEDYVDENSVPLHTFTIKTDGTGGDGGTYSSDSTNSSGSWTSDPESVACGLIRFDADGVARVYETGHKYTLEEDPEFHWEMDPGVYRMMAIGREATETTNASYIPTVLQQVTGSDIPTAMVDDTDLVYYTDGTDDFYRVGSEVYKAISTGTTLTLTAHNIRRNNLNLIKQLVNADGTPSTETSTAEFTFTFKVTDANGDKVWFSVFPSATATTPIMPYDAATNPDGVVVTGDTVEAEVDVDTGEYTGYFSADSADDTITVKMKPGWNLRYTNLPVGSTYEITESGIPTPYAFYGGSLTPSGQLEDQFVVTEDDAKIEGTIGNNNTSYVVTAKNKNTATVDLTLGGTKKMTGRDMEADEFTFQLYKVEGTTETLLQTATNVAGADGVVTDFTFATALSYGLSDVGNTYTYKVKEVTGTANGVAYDTAVYTVSVAITQNDDGTLAATPTYTKDGASATSIAFVNSYAVTESTVIKEWDDNGATITIPESLTVYLHWEYTEEGDNAVVHSGLVGTYTLGANTTPAWTKTVSGLPLIQEGHEVTYYWTEAVPAGWVLDKAEVDETTHITTLTNVPLDSYGPRTDYPGIKHWDCPTDMIPALTNPPTVVLHWTYTDDDGTYTGIVKKNGTNPVIIPNTTSTENYTPLWEQDDNDPTVWHFTFADLPVFSDTGAAIHYWADETVVPTGFVHDSDEDVIDPTSYTLVETVGSLEPETTCAVFDFDLGSELNLTFVGVKKGDDYLIWTPRPALNAEKALIRDALGVRESEVKRYISGVPATFNPEGVFSGATGFVYFGITGRQVHVQFSKPSDWSWFKYGSFVVNGGYDPGSTQITNSITPTTLQIPAKKVVTGDSPNTSELFTFTLSAVSAQTTGGTAIDPIPMPATGGTTVQVTAGSTDYFGAISFDQPGTYVYKVNETAGTTPGMSYDTSDHEVTITVTNDSGTLSASITYGLTDNYVTITNTPVTIDIPVVKVWASESTLQPESVKVKLYKQFVSDSSTKTEVDTQTLSAENTPTPWSYTWEDMPKYGNNGTTVEELIYTVAEDPIPIGYTVAITGDESGFTITNTPHETDVSVLKVWDDAENQDGKRPEAIRVQLYQTIGSGTETMYGDAVTLSADNTPTAWSYIWEHLPAKWGDDEITYRVDEVEVPTEYEKTVTNEGTAYTITNTHEPETTTITAIKHWNDDSDSAGKRVGVVATFELQKTVDGISQTIRSVEVGKDQDWTHTWKDLPVYEKGKAITYSVREVLTKAKGYSCDTTSWKTVSNGGKITITNTLKDDSPGTGDNTKILLWSGLTLVSAIGFGGVLAVSARKKKKETEE